MVDRLMGISEFIKPTNKRKANDSRAAKLRQRKAAILPDCFFTVGNTSEIIDDEVLEGM